MSKPANNGKISAKSAWARGPPASNASGSSSGPSSPTTTSPPPRPSSPGQTPRGTHSRKPSQLSQQINDGVAVSMARAPTHQPRGSMSFGTINDSGSAAAAAAPVSSSPAAVAPTRSEGGVMSFGQLPAAPRSASPAPSSASAAKAKFDIKKLFQSSTPAAAPTPAPVTPPAPSTNGSYRQNGAPRSPVHSRQLPNGNRPPGPPPGPPGPSGLPSPSLPQQNIPGMPPQSGMPPQQPQMAPGWPQGYYYDPNYMTYVPHQWGYMPHMAQQMPPQQMPPPQQGQHPMSPRSAPIPPQPTTPTPAHAAPNSSPLMPVSIPPTSHSSSSSISSPPATPSGSNAQSARLNPNSNAFVPGNRSSKIITLRKPDGSDLEIPNYRHPSGSGAPTVPTTGSVSPQTPGSPSASNRRSVIRMESEDAKKKRLAEEQEKENKSKAADQAKKSREHDEKRTKQEEAEKELKRKDEEAKRKADAAAAKAKKEAEEATRLKKKEEEEKARVKKEQEEEAEQERKRAEDEANTKRQQEEQDALTKKLEEERNRKEEQEKQTQETAKSDPPASPAPAEPFKALEDGEIKESTPVAAEVKSDVKFPVSKKEGLRIETDGGRKTRPGPLDLSGAKKNNIVAPLPSALATAKHINKLDPAMYPEGIQSPKVDLNVDAKDGKFRYDRDFLLQFMNICKEKPDQLPPLDAIGLEPQEQNFAMTRSSSGRHRQVSNASNQSRGAVGLGISGPFPKPGSTFGSGGIGNFNTGKALGTSEERFRTSSLGGGTQANRSGPPINRTTSQGGPGAMKNQTNRTRSQRGKDRGQGGNPPPSQMAAPPMEPIIPLQATANAWNRRNIQPSDAESPEMVERKVKGLLNKLTMEKFDSISDQIIAWANKSEKEKDGRTLIQVIRLVFEKATDEAAWSEMYARLCRKMMEQISAKVQDDGIKNAEGKPIAGGQLFRKYLLNRCQEDFERGWVAKEATAAAAASKANEDEAVKAANEKKKGDAATEADEEVALYSEEYYLAQKAKRQGLGLIRFIGELFKLQMLTERIMHECMKKLLGNVETPEEEEIESLCKLLSTVGAILDNNKARAHMDVYFSRMHEMTKSPNVSSRMHFMLQDVIELRDRKWSVRSGGQAAPTTIAAVREAAAKEKAAQEKDSYRLQQSMSRGGSRRGGDRNDQQQVGPDGWSVAGPVAPRPPAKAGDLSNFGKIAKGGAPMSFGPSSVFNKKGGGEPPTKRESMSRTNSSSNMFSMLQNAESASEDVAGNKNGGKPPSRKTSVDLGHGDPDVPPQRKRLALLPRTKTVENVTPNASRPVSEDGEAEDASDEPQLSEADAKKKIAQDEKEFFAIRNIDEAETYFAGLPPPHHQLLVEQFTSHALESKASDADLVAALFARAVEKQLVVPSAFEQGFAGLAELVEDIAIDAPKAFELMAAIIKAASLDVDTRSRVSSKDASGKLAPLLS